MAKIKKMCLLDEWKGIEKCVRDDQNYVDSDCDILIDLLDRGLSHKECKHYRVPGDEDKLTEGEEE